jgi:hypothetical protein
MKFRCKCGHVIKDQTDNLPYKAEIIPDQSLEALYEALDEVMNRKKPKDVFERDRLLEPISNPKGSKLIYQCEQCGRITIDAFGPRLFSFKPEDQATPKNLLSHDS